MSLYCHQNGIAIVDTWWHILMFTNEVPVMKVLAAAVAGSILAFSSLSQATEYSYLEFIGEAQFPTGFQFQETEVGGLSGIDYDARTDTYLAISDDRAQINTARFYELSIDLGDGYLDDGDVNFLNVTEILDKTGESFNELSLDPESIRVSSFPNLLYWSSEGDANAGLEPFVRVMTRQGQFVDEYRIPEKYLPTDESGIRNNQAFESLTFSYDGADLITATEGALKQDGELASLEQGSPVRVLALSQQDGNAVDEFVYITDAVTDQPVPVDAFKTNGLVELLSVGYGHYLAIERSFSVGVGNNIRMYLTSTYGATSVLKTESIADLKYLRAMPKRLVLDLGELGITLDNIEGVTFGPRLSSGEKTLILVSDNNFNPQGQFTQFLAFKINHHW